jgi:hypothetical protein
MREERVSVIDFVVPDYIEKHLKELREKHWKFQVIYASQQSNFGAIQLHAKRGFVIIVGRGITHEDAYVHCIEAVLQYADGPVIAIYKGGNEDATVQ